MIEIVDDLLTEAEQDNLIFLAKNRTNWQFFENTSRPGLKSDELPDPYETGNFHSKLKNVKEDNDYIKFNKIPYLLTRRFLKGTRLETSRMKINFTWRQPEEHRGRPAHPHVDEFEQHYVVIYYLIDSDGDTIIYNQTQGYDDAGPRDYPVDAEQANLKGNLTVAARVTPKKGRAVIFNGEHLHSVCACIDNPNRMIVNYNLLVK